jgi:leucyl aminopeptidase (aminopeptidase T)
MSPSADSPVAAADLARSVLRKNLQVKPGESVTIEAWTHTLPYAVALAREARRLKAHPIVLYEDESAYWDSVEHGETKLLGANSPHEWAALAKTDVYLFMWGPGDRVRLNALPEKKSDELFGFNGPWYESAKKAGLRGARLEIGRPFPTLATAYGVDEAEWREQIHEASLVDPAQLAKSAAPLAKILQKGKRLRLRDAQGTDLTLGLAGRRPRSLVGRFEPGDLKDPFGMLMTLPTGAVRVALDEAVADGTLVANRTCYYDDGKATDAVFEFANGKLTEARFGSGRERFHGPYAKAGPGRDRPGMFSIGLNPKLHDTPQLEDLEAGALMVSVGGNQNLGGKNKAAFFGWAVTAGATLEVDGKRVNLPG